MSPESLNYSDFATLSDNIMWAGKSPSERTWLNRAWYKYAGEVNGPDNWYSVVHPDDFQRLVDFSPGDTITIEYRLRSQSGNYEWFRDSIVVRDNADGKWYYGTLQNVDEVFRLRAKYHMISEAMEQSLAGFDIVDENGLFVYANPAYIQMWGYDTVSEIIGTSPVPHCADPDIPRQIIENLHKNSSGLHEFTAKRKDGSTFEVLMATRMHIDREGHKYYFGTAIDMTEKKELQKKFQQSHKMDLVGQLASGMAHDFNNILTVISGYADLAGQPGGLALDECVPPIKEAVRQGSLLTRHLLTMARREFLEVERISLNEAIRPTVKMIDRLLPDSITLEADWSQEDVYVLADRGQLEQILLNLILNARDAMPSGGQILIGTSRAKKSAILWVTDNGHGMDEETQHKILEPFFTTKGERGSGLGLSTVHEIVRKLNGELLVRSKIGEGTTFEMHLPEADRQLRVGPKVGPVDDPAGKETVIVVDNAREVREIIRRQLATFGYEVSAYPGPQALLAEIPAWQTGPDLCVIDMVMPEMSGRELAENIRKFFPGTKVLYVSGYTNDNVLRESIEAGREFFLQKPFSAMDLAGKVRNLLDN